MSAEVDNQAVTDEPPPPLLRTLAPLLRGLERPLRTWLDSRRKFPLSMMQRAELEGLADDLHRQADTLDVEKPLLVVMLMGGTGVGKSTLLNALAGGADRAGVVHPPDHPRPGRLLPPLRQDRAARPGVARSAGSSSTTAPGWNRRSSSIRRTSTPTTSPTATSSSHFCRSRTSCSTSGSQEKYHDRLGWDLFKEQRQRRAFAFVLNKWDRCVTGESGVQPGRRPARGPESGRLPEPAAVPHDGATLARRRKGARRQRDSAEARGPAGRRAVRDCSATGSNSASRGSKSKRSRPAASDNC